GFTQQFPEVSVCVKNEQERRRRLIFCETLPGLLEPISILIRNRGNRIVNQTAELLILWVGPHTIKHPSNRRSLRRLLRVDRLPDVRGGIWLACDRVTLSDFRRQCPRKVDC